MLCMLPKHALDPVLGSTPQSSHETRLDGWAVVLPTIAGEGCGISKLLLLLPELLAVLGS
jgi:hypothetical protein